MPRRFLAAALLLIAAAPAFADPPAAALPATFDVPAVDAYLAHQVKEKGYVGLSIAVVRNGEVILAKGYGQTTVGGPAVRPDTPFAIGSVTKQFACACVLLL